jgi:hypothetical protein
LNFNNNYDNVQNGIILVECLHTVCAMISAIYPRWLGGMSPLTNQSRARQPLFAAGEVDSVVQKGNFLAHSRQLHRALAAMLDFVAAVAAVVLVVASTVAVAVAALVET